MSGPVDFTSILQQPGVSNVGGLIETHYFAPVSYATLPLPALPAWSAIATPGLGVVMATEPTWATGKGWLPIYATRDNGEVKSDLEGPVDSQGFKISFDLFLPGTYKENLGFMAYGKDVPLLFLINQSDGVSRFIGNNQFYARFEKAAGASGKKYGDKNGSLITIYSYGNTPAPIATFTPTLHP